MKVRSEEYATLREWFGHVSEKVFPPQIMSQAQPLTQLDQLAERSPAKARDGLSMGINDLIEVTGRLPAEEVQAIDDELAKKRLPTLTQMRIRFSKMAGRAIRRGHIKDEVEYYAVRNAAELAGNSERLWSLLAAYEQSAAR